MAETDTPRQNISRLEMIIDQEFMLRALWKEIAQENNIQPNRRRENVVWRHAFLVAATETTALSLKAIGRVMNKDHATVLHARKQHEMNFTYDRRYNAIYLMMISELQALMDQYRKQMEEVILKRKVPVHGGQTMESIIDMYERKLQSQEKRYKTQLADYQLKMSILEKEKNKQQERAEKLNKECLRLKNLL